MKRYILLLLSIIFAVLLSNAQSYKVIVNKANPNVTLTTKEVSNFFLKKKTKWDNGEKVLPIDLNSRSAVRQSFSKEVIGKSVGAVKSYWQQYVFAGKGNPPIEKNSDTDVINYIKAHSGSIGYVSPQADISDVKELKITK
jgi:ABC-type phosphate transport system substrate-binding protein